jgi:SAM-dependent methyltransferase
MTRPYDSGMVDGPAQPLPALYERLAEWWPLFSHPDDYLEEATFYATLLADGSRTRRTVLELGSGGGNNAHHLRRHFDMTLVDLSPAMIEVSRALNPGCEHVVGDMRTARLERRFDAVFVHDAVMYLTTEEGLRATMETAHRHCAPGGVALFVPDWTRESLRPSTDHGGHDGEGRALRYLEWTWDPDPRDQQYVVDFAILLRAGDGSVRIEQDRHFLGVFPRATWLRLLEEVGFKASAVDVPDSGEWPEGAEVFLGRR